ncbi:MAG: hypothetical protein HZA95_00130 [Candidatus Vogelbacteria bacterium]|nr:hypothetical protein [Candidatus Vogelbacteria bacterium]
MSKIIIKSIVYGIVAGAILLGIYFGLLTFISGWIYAKSQFADYSYFIVSLASGFGIQFALYTYLKNMIMNGDGSAKILGVTGTTSTLAMVSCCTHYLVNLLPILGVTGLMTFVSAYQTQLFWLGLLFNLSGIVYMLKKIIDFRTRRKTVQTDIAVTTN